MKDTQEWAEKLRREAEECRLISKLATNLEKREVFTRLAETIDRQADELEAVIASGNLPEK
jgi:anaerobic glycerol-3-phosphate dehydrogenase